MYVVQGHVSAACWRPGRLHRAWQPLEHTGAGLALRRPEQACQISFFECFPYVCPEPVLAK